MKKSELLKRIEELEREIALLQLQQAVIKTTEYVPYPVYPYHPSPYDYYPTWPYPSYPYSVTGTGDTFIISAGSGTVNPGIEFATCPTEATV